MLNICALPPALETHVGEGMGRGGGATANIMNKKRTMGCTRLRNKNYFI